MRHRDRDSGATIVEVSMVLPIVVLIMIGTLEIGLAFKDYLTVSYASREGARVGALSGDRATADCDVVHSVMDVLGTSDLSDLKRIEIYRADPNTGNQIGAQTNTWTYIGSDPYDCANDWLVVETWPSTSRNVLFGPTSTLDILGVRIVTNHDYITGLPPFSGNFELDEATITRLEPEGFE
jgi:hypothetical protein